MGFLPPAATRVGVVDPVNGFWCIVQIAVEGTGREGRVIIFLCKQTWKRYDFARTHFDVFFFAHT